MVNFGPLAAEIVSLVWGTPANFNGFGVLFCFSKPVYRIQLVVKPVDNWFDNRLYRVNGV